MSQSHSTPSSQNQATPTTEATMERPKALDALARQEPCVVLSSTTDPRAGEVEHLILMVEERDAILAYIERLEAKVERAS